MLLDMAYLVCLCKWAFDFHILHDPRVHQLLQSVLTGLRHMSVHWAMHELDAMYSNAYVS